MTAIPENLQSTNTRNPFSGVVEGKTTITPGQQARSLEDSERSMRAMLRATGKNPDDFGPLTPFEKPPVGPFSASIASPYGSDIEQALTGNTNQTLRNTLAYNRFSDEQKARYDVMVAGNADGVWERANQRTMQRTQRDFESLVYPVDDDYAIATAFIPNLVSVPDDDLLNSIRSLKATPQGKKSLETAWVAAQVKALGIRNSLEQQYYLADAFSVDGTVLMADWRRLCEDEYGGRLRAGVNLGKDFLYGVANVSTDMVLGGSSAALTALSLLQPNEQMVRSRYPFGPLPQEDAGSLEEALTRQSPVEGAVESLENISETMDTALYRSPVQSGGNSYRGASMLFSGAGSVVPFTTLSTAPTLLRYFAGVGVGYEEARQTALSYGVSRENSRLVGLGSGLISGALEMIGTDMIVRAWRTPSPIGQFTKNIFGAGLGEGLTEGAQSLTASAAGEVGLMMEGEYFFDPERAWDAAHNAVVEAGLGAALGGLFAFGGSGPVRTMFRQVAWRSNQRFLNTGVERLSRIPDLKTNPEAVKIVAKDIREQSNAQDTQFIDGEAFVNYFQGDLNRMQRAMVDLDITQQQLDTARQAGAQVMVSSEALVVYDAANNPEGGLREYAQAEPEAPTLRALAEEVKANQEAAEELRRIRTENRELPTAAMEFRQQLIDRDMDPELAQYAADVNLAFATVAGTRMGLTAEQYLNLNPIKVILANQVNRAREMGVTAGDIRFEREMIAAQDAYTRYQAERTGKHEYIPSPDGQADYSMIPEEIASTPAARQAGFESAAIRMEKGTRFWGWRHIDNGHRKQIQAAGYKSIEAFVQDIANNFDEVRKGSRDGRFLLVKRAADNNVLAVQLTMDEEGKYYSVTNGLVRKGNVNGELIWERRTTLSSDSGYPTPLNDSGQPLNQAAVQQGQMGDLYGREGQINPPLGTIPAEGSDVNTWTQEAVNNILEQSGIAPEQAEAFVQYAQAMVEQGLATDNAAGMAQEFQTANVLAEGAEQQVRGLERILANPAEIGQAVFDAMGIQAQTVQEGLAEIQRQITELGRRAQRYRDFQNNPQAVQAVRRLTESLRDVGQRGDATVAPDLNLVRLFSGRQDHSTILHELYHVYNDQFVRAAKAEGAPAQLVADFNTLNEAVGGGLDANIGSEARRNAEEQAAKMFEKYLSEGRAPSPRLANAFRRFRTWLTNIYRAVRDFAEIDLTPETRGVFDRMLATESEIAQADQFYRTVDVLTPPVDATPEQAQSIAERTAEARAQTEERHFVKVLNQYIAGEGGRKELRRRASEEVSAQRPYQVIAAIREAGGISRAVAVDAIGAADASRITENHGRLYKDNPGIDEVGLARLAEDYGYERVSDMLSEMASVVSRREAVNNLTNRRVSEAEAFLRTSLEQDTATPVDEAYHNDQLSRALSAKQAVLDEQARHQAEAEGRRTERQLNNAALRRIAEDVIAGTKGNRATNYLTYVSAYRRHAEAAAHADAARDKITAAREYQQMRLNHFLIKEAIRARQDIQRFARRNTGVNAWVRRLEGTDRRKVAPVIESFRNAIKDVLTTFKVVNNPRLQPTIPEGGLGPQIDVPGPNASTDPEIAALATSLAEYLPPWILDRQGADKISTWRDLTVGQIRELGDALDILTEQGRGEMRALQMPGITTINQAIAESIRRMERRDPRPAQYGRGTKNDSFINKLLNARDNFLVKALVPEYILAIADGNTNITGGGTGPLQNIALAFRRGIEGKNTMYANDLQKIQPARRVLQKFTKRFKNINKDLLGSVPEGITQAYGVRDWDAEMYVMVALNVGTDHNLNAITKGYGMDVAQIEQILSVFTGEELDAIQSIGDVLGSHFQEIDDVTYRLTNRRTVKEEPRPFTVMDADGNTKQMRGWYFPLRYDGLVDRSIGGSQEYEVTMNRAAKTAVRGAPRTKDGFTVARVGAARPPVLRLDTIASHLDNVAQYIHLAEAVKEADAITANGDFERVFVSRFGDAWYRSLRQYVKYVANPDGGSLGGNDPAIRVLNWMRRKGVTAALGFRVKTGLKQRLDTVPAIQHMTMHSRNGTSGLRYWLIGMRDIGFAGNLGFMNQRIQQIYEKSSFMRDTEGNVSSDIREQLKIARGDTRVLEIAGWEITLETALNLSYAFMTSQDRAARSAIWAGAYQMAMDGNGDFDPANMSLEQREQAAIKFADGAAATFSATTAADLTAWQRDQGFMRLFTTFLTGTVRRSSRLYQYFDALRQGQLTVPQFARAFVMDAAVQAWIPAFMAMALQQMLGDDDDDELTAGGILFDVFVDPVLSVIDGVPLFNTGSSLLRYQRGDVVVPSGINEFSRRFNSAVSAKKNITKDEWDKAAWKGATLFGYVAGVPFENIYREARPALEALGVVEEKD